MQKSFLVFVSALGLAACGGERSGTIETEDGETVEYSVDSGDGEMTATFQTGDGEGSIRSGSDVAVDLPDGFSVYPGAKVVTNTVMNTPDGKGAMVVMESDASPEEMVAFYKTAAEKAGFKIGMEMTTDSNVMIAGESAANGDNPTSGFSFSAGREGDKTSGQLMIGDSFR